MSFEKRVGIILFLYNSSVYIDAFGNSRYYYTILRQF